MLVGAQLPHAVLNVNQVKMLDERLIGGFVLVKQSTNRENDPER